VFQSALMSKSGVRTPLAGMFTAIGVIVALYGLTSAFFWIPSAALSAVIIHAVADLVAKPTQVYGFWRVSPLEFIIFTAALLVTIFSTIENGIYTAIIASVILLLIRVAHPRGQFLGKVTVHSDAKEEPDTKRQVYVPLHPGGGVMNPYLRVEPPVPGVIIYRFEESFLFPNSSLANSALLDYIKTNTRRGKDMQNMKASHRQWNDPGPRPGARVEDDSHKPLLRAIVLDFSGV
jgi:solute carrier family 26 (sodium-independent sulfate anion transporter), member 11